MSILYISYDGLADNLGRSQIIPYISGLSGKPGLRFSVLSFEKPVSLRDTGLMNSIENELNAAGIRWVSLAYHKRPSLLATVYDIIHGVAAGTAIIAKDKVQLIHGRSFIGSVIAFLLKKIFNRKVIFDVRGFWPEERVEAGLWKQDGWLYKASKRVERSLVESSDQIITLTSKGRDEYIKRYAYKKNIAVIPTCVDTNMSYPQGADRFLIDSLRKDKRFVIAYAGSLSTWYMPGEMLDFFYALKRIIPAAFFLVLTKEVALLKGLLDKSPGTCDDIAVRCVEHKLVPAYLSTAAAGLAFYRPGYSRLACCPTKVGEYLAQGLPVVISSGVGDCDDVIKRENVGVVLNNFSSAEFASASKQLKELLADGAALEQRCRASAKKYYSLDMGIDKYRTIYSNMMHKNGAGRK